MTLRQHLHLSANKTKAQHLHLSANPSLPAHLEAGARLATYIPPTLEPETKELARASGRHRAEDAGLPISYPQQA